MKAEIKPTEKIEKLEENLKPRVKSIEKKSGKLHIQASELDFLERVPGIKEYSINGEQWKGMGGSPVDEKA